MIEKGTIVSMDGSSVKILPEGSEVLTTWITVPTRLRRSVKKGIAVVYVMFSDGTGMVLERTDGETPEVNY